MSAIYDYVLNNIYSQKKGQSKGCEDLTEGRDFLSYVDEIVDSERLYRQSFSLGDDASYNPLYDESIANYSWLEPAEPLLDDSGNPVLDCVGNPKVKLTEDHLSHSRHTDLPVGEERLWMNERTLKRVYPGGDGNFYTADGTYACTQEELERNWSLPRFDSATGLADCKYYKGLGTVGYGADGYLHDLDGNIITQEILDSTLLQIRSRQENDLNFSLKTPDMPQLSNNNSLSRWLKENVKEVSNVESMQRRLVDNIAERKAEPYTEELSQLRRSFNRGDITEAEFNKESERLELIISDIKADITERYGFPEDDDYPPGSVFDGATLLVVSGVLAEVDGEEGAELALSILSGYRRSFLYRNPNLFSTMISQIAGSDFTKMDSGIFAEDGALFKEICSKFPTLNDVAGGDLASRLNGADKWEFMQKVMSAFTTDMNHILGLHLQEYNAGIEETKENLPQVVEYVEDDPRLTLLELLSEDASEPYYIPDTYKYEAFLRNGLIDDEAYNHHMENITQMSQTIAEKIEAKLSYLDPTNEDDLKVFGAMEKVLTEQEGRDAYTRAKDILESYYSAINSGRGEQYAQYISMVTDVENYPVTEIEEVEQESTPKRMIQSAVEFITIHNTSDTISIQSLDGWTGRGGSAPAQEESLSLEQMISQHRKFLFTSDGFTATSMGQAAKQELWMLYPWREDAFSEVAMAGEGEV